VDIEVVGWFLEGEISWCLVKGIGISCRLVPKNIIVHLVLKGGHWCHLQVASCKYCNNRLVPTRFYKDILCLFLPFGFSH